MNKFFIKNRKRQDISVIVEERNDLQKGSPSRSTSAAPQVVAKGDSRSPLSGLAFVMHGLGGFKEQKHIAAIAETFIEKSFTVVRFDAADTLGESGGKYEDATVTNYYQDLEDVIAWARTQLWYREPFALAGHSLGGMCVGLYAQKHPERVLAVAPVSPVVSGALSVQAHKRYEPEDFAQWKKTGWQETESRSQPGKMKRLPWSHMIDRLRYDLLPGAQKLTMPVLLVVGEHDDVTPPEHVRILYEALPEGHKEFQVIKNAKHTFRDTEHLKEIKRIFSDWIDGFPA